MENDQESCQSLQEWKPQQVHLKFIYVTDSTHLCEHFKRWSTWEKQLAKVCTSMALFFERIGRRKPLLSAEGRRGLQSWNWTNQRPCSSRYKHLWATVKHGSGRVMIWAFLNLILAASSDWIDRELFWIESNLRPSVQQLELGWSWVLLSQTHQQIYNRLKKEKEKKKNQGVATDQRWRHHSGSQSSDLNLTETL